MQAAFSLEDAILTSLVAAKRELNLLGDTSLDSLATASISQLFTKDIFPKLRSLINGYGGNPNKIYPVSIVALGVTKQAQLLNLTVPADLLSTVLTDINNAGKFYLSNLQNNHDYSAITAIFSVSKALIQLNGDPSSILTKPTRAIELSVDSGHHSGFADGYLQGSLSRFCLHCGGEWAVIHHVCVRDGFARLRNLQLYLRVDNFLRGYGYGCIYGPSFTKSVFCPKLRSGI